MKSWTSNYEVLFSYVMSECSFSKQDGIIKLSKKINDRNLDGIFRLILMIYGKNMKKYVLKFMQNNLRNSMTKNRFLQHVQKTDDINWAWSEITDGAQRKLFPKCKFFWKNPQKVDLHFLCHLIWPSWFNFLVHDLSV